ncbi:murein biosynthesis integral membrane protein MurJ [Peptostreptococcus sp.]|uniref:murein biosynthesis integral membrane protein MurJ n=1 Tax=Peptostreptococcus sp. TaxID=1262 RepID=UPI001CAD17D1|nr:murein biosynthesis integral membrane protein MurJ [Peptostreptococcus sp.]MBF1049553.1 murein biosynthesis integral membrane protein MurJ [Peptostreptococcus sp.]
MSKAARATVLLMIVTIVSKILGLFRDSVLASAYGTGKYAAVYSTANSISTILFAVIGTALATSLIPLYNKLASEDSTERAMGFLNSVVNLVVIVCLSIAGLGIIFAGPLVKVFAPGYQGDVYTLCVQYTRILLPSIVFVGLANIFTSYLQIKKRYVIPGFIGMPYSIIIIVSIYLSLKTSPMVLVIGTLIAISAKALFQLPFVYKEGYRYRPKINLKDPVMKDMMILILPVVIGVGANQINSIVDKSLASLLGTEVVASFSYAIKLYEFVQALFITSILAVIYPRLSSMIVSDRMDSFLNSLKKTMNVIIVALVPIIVGCIILSRQIVEVLFQRNAFTSKDTTMTASILWIYVIGILAFALRDVLTRGFYSMEDSKTPMINSIISIVFNISLNLILVKPLGYKGLAIATAVSAYIGLLLFNRSMRKKIEGYSSRDNYIVFVKSLFAALIMGLGVKLVYGIVASSLVGGLLFKLIALASAVGVGVIIYALIMHFLRVEEYEMISDMFFGVVKKKVKRLQK